MASYEFVYGTFAAIPFFLFWLYWSWMIVLFGAETTFAIQNHRTYEQESSAATANPATRVKLAMLIVHDIVSHHAKGKTWIMQSFNEGHNIPVRLIRDVLDILTESHIIAETASPSGGYVPARDPDSISMADIFLGFQGKPDQSMNKLTISEKTDINDHFDTQIGTFVANLDKIKLRQLITPSKR